VQISYPYLAVLLVFTLLTGVVIGDRLAASAGGSQDGGRSGGCTGLASARLHECVHRLGHLRSRQPGGSHTDFDPSCEIDSNRRNRDNGE
jgi:hypothetical protein